MSSLDWLVLILTLLFVVVYGVIKSRNQSGVDTYLLADKKMPAYMVLLSVMATQASAITFLSAPGQAYTDGMRFVQYYFGLPLAMIVICISFIPIFQRLKVYTAYEFLEQRFDSRTRWVTAFLFLVSRALSTGISIYAPSIILSSILGWNIYITNLVMGGLLIIYTLAGGAKAIAHTQKILFLIILASMALAGYLIVQNLPVERSISDALMIAGKSGKLNAITTEFDWKDKYNIWSGIIGGFFLALSYFGTDNSQVSRYLTGKNIRESRMGLLMNGLVKIPMQFLILFIGALLFSYYTFYSAPLNFNERAYQALAVKEPAQTSALESRYATLHGSLQQTIPGVLAGEQPAVETMQQIQTEISLMRDTVQQLIIEHVSKKDTNDVNYIFLYYVTHHLPKGIIGLLFAVIFLASWGSISAALNSLAGSSLMDLPFFRPGPGADKKQQLSAGRWHTFFWGMFCIAVAMFATKLGSLIEAVNVLGSIFYGTILGIFLVAFYGKKLGGQAVFYAICLAQVLVILIYSLDWVSFLWLNLIGAALVVGLAFLFEGVLRQFKLKQ